MQPWFYCEMRNVGKIRTGVWTFPDITTSRKTNPCVNSNIGSKNERIIKYCLLAFWRPNKCQLPLPGVFGINVFIMLSCGCLLCFPPTQTTSMHQLCTDFSTVDSVWLQMLTREANVDSLALTIVPSKYTVTFEERQVFKIK